MGEAELREQICEIGRLMHQMGYIDATSGNISARLGDNLVLMTPGGVPKWQLQPDDLLVVDINGNIQGAGKPTSEMPMHLVCYQKREDVGGVVHAHPPHAVALTIAGVPLQQFIIPEAIIMLGLTPTLPYATPSSVENRETVQAYIEHHDVLMLTNHGSLTVAPSVWDAYLKLETLEHVAKITSEVFRLGAGINRLTWEQLEKLLAQRQAMGLSHAGEIQLFEKFYKTALDFHKAD